MEKLKRHSGIKFGKKTTATTELKLSVVVVGSMCPSAEKVAKQSAEDFGNCFLAMQSKANQVCPN